MTGIPKKRKGYGQIVKNGDKNGGEGCGMTDAEGSSLSRVAGTPSLPSAVFGMGGRRIVCTEEENEVKKNKLYT